jgi:hypothetical protein
MGTDWVQFSCQVAAFGGMVLTVWAFRSALRQARIRLTELTQQVRELEDRVSACERICRGNVSTAACHSTPAGRDTG